ncbi:MAG TPA: NRDE family protein [Thermoanaerobaculia bacterium]
MCTLIALHRCTPAAPLVVAANRDEQQSRPAEKPALRFERRLPVVAPRDLRAGGTWIGVNSSGLLAAVTNRPTRSRDDARRSRGLVVLDALEHASARAAAEASGSLARDAYNPFNLFLADGRDAFAVVYEGAPRVSLLAPGVHVICNADPDARTHPKVDRLLARAEAAAGLPPERLLGALADVCRSHDGGGSPLDDACIHGDGYGTRSSTLLRLGEPGTGTFWFADGPPCRTPYEDFTSLLPGLHRGAECRAEGSTARTIV